MVTRAINRLGRGHKIGKYKLLKKLGEGGFGVVYKAYDEVEGVHVALKLQDPLVSSPEMLRYFKQEIRLLSKVDHPNVLKMKNADVYQGRLYFVTELGLCNLAEREKRIFRLNFAIDVLRQILEALVEVQKHKIVHRDIKPENIILFENNVIKLADFGVAKVLERAGTVLATDAGTQGYCAPEQLFGKPSFASDIFSLGLVFYEMTTGKLPRWPFTWPFSGGETFNRRIPKGLRKVIRKALEFDEDERYPDAGAMCDDVVKFVNRFSAPVSSPSRKRMIPWRKYREQEFAERFQNVLALNYRCHKCNGPISEFMMHCPWCGTDKNSFRGITAFPSACKRCEHGVMDEWDYCPWCYGKKFSWADVWVQEDKKYIKNCSNKYCAERKVMRWMHYCPWCQVKLKPWKFPTLQGTCRKCGWSVAGDYWDHCPWCGVIL